MAEQQKPKKIKWPKDNTSLYLDLRVIARLEDVANAQDRSSSYIADRILKGGLGIPDDEDV